MPGSVVALRGADEVVLIPIPRITNGVTLKTGVPGTTRTLKDDTEYTKI